MNDIKTSPSHPPGDCTATLGHLVPTDRGEYYPCIPSAPSSCQAGNLAGKHGNITTTSFSSQYLDLYLSATEGGPYYFGDKSVAIHSRNTTRLSCANFVLVNVGNGTTTSGGENATSTSAGTATSTPAQVSANEVGKIGRASLGLVGLGVGVVFLL